MTYWLNVPHLLLLIVVEILNVLNYFYSYIRYNESRTVNVYFKPP